MMKKMRFLFVVFAVLFVTNGQAQEIERKKFSDLTERHALNDSVKFVAQRDSLGLRKNYKFSLATLRRWLSDGSSSPVSSVASGNLAPLFTVAVMTPSTTPVFVFSLTPVASGRIWGNNSGSTGAPAYFAPLLAAAPFGNEGATNKVLHGNVSGLFTWSEVSLVNDVTGVLAADKGGSGHSSYTVGDINYASGTTTLSKLGIGTTGYVLKVVGGVPAWAGESVTETNTVTFTNKRWTMRSTTVTTVSATPSINTDNQDIYVISAQAVNITNMSTNLTGTPVVGDLLEIIITGTGAGTISWGSSFVDGDFTLPTAFGTTTKIIVVQYLTTSFGTNKWTCVRS